MSDFDIRLVEVDEGVVEGELLHEGAFVAAFMANVFVVDRVASISQLHIDGAGPNSLGMRRLRRAMFWLMDELKVDEIVVAGGQRVTGAARGRVGTGPRTPARLSFKRESS